MPKISIIIPVYNVEKYIEEALDSVINQTLKDIEIICVDDCSTDSSFSIVKEYAQKDKRIKIFQQKENKGQGCTRNTGLKNATGEYIMFLDPDDYYEPDTCELAYKQITENNNDYVAFNFYDLNQETGEKVINTKYLKPFKNKFSERKIKLCEFERPFVQGCVTVMNIYKHSFLTENNIKYAEDIRLGEDVIFYFQVVATAETMSVIDKPLYTYRHHKKSSSNTAELCWQEHFTARERAYDIIKKSKHAKHLMKSCIRYIITSNLHWYKEWFPDKDMPNREEFYNKLRLMFQKVDDNNDVEEIKPYINYNEFKYMCAHNCEEYDKYLENPPVIPVKMQKEEQEKISDILISCFYNNDDFEYALKLFVLQKIIEENGFHCEILKYKGFNYSTNKLFNDFAKENLSFTKKYNIYEAQALSAEKKGIFYLTDNLLYDFERNKHISLLNFAENNCKKILISGSIKDNNISKETSDLMRMAFNSFDYISVSDTESRNFFAKNFHIPTEEILSPLFLLKDYDEILDKSLINVRNKIVVYCKNETDLATNIPVYTLDIGKNTIYDYVKAVKDCRLLITDSLNTIYPALIFNTPFVYINKEVNREIFETLKIGNNIISDINELNMANNYIPDWAYINNYIKLNREKYISILENILKNGYSNNSKAISNKKKNRKYLINKKYTLKNKLKYANYIKCRVLANVSSGEAKEHYISKKKRIINELNKIFDE